MLRPDLEPPPWNEAHFERVFDLCQQTRNAADKTSLAQRLAELIGRGVAEEDLRDDPYSMALRLASPVVRVVGDVTDAELREMVQRTRANDEQWFYLQTLFLAHTTPAASRYFLDRSLSPDQVVQRARKM